MFDLELRGGSIKLDSVEPCVCWQLNGKFHRENGPAVEWSDGGRHWSLNGRTATEEEVIGCSS